MSLLITFGSSPSVTGIEWFYQWFEDDDKDDEDYIWFIYSQSIIQARPHGHRGFLRNVGRMLNA